MEPPLTAAQALVRVPGAVVSGEEAARRLGIELVEGSGRCQLTVPRNWSHVVVPGWQVVRRDLWEDEARVLDDGLRVTSPSRTVADLACEMPLDHAVAAADSALRLHLVTAALLTEVLTGRRGPDGRRRRQVAALLDPRAGSVLESLLRVLLVSSGVAAPVTQHVIGADPREAVRVDFAWPEQRLVVEADGFAFHSDREAYRTDRARMNELERLGWRVLRFTWEDVVGRPAHVVGLVRACLAQAA